MRRQLQSLLNEALAAHGGLDRWRQFQGVASTILTGGRLWDIKQANLIRTLRRATSEFHRQWTQVAPFGEPDWTMTWVPEHVAITNGQGTIIAQRDQGREAFDRRYDAPWDPLNVAYFNGYAMWTYHAVPFVFADPGYEARESMSVAAPVNTRLRLERGANVLAAAQATGVRRYLRQSIAFWAVPGPGWADEETPLAFDASPAVAADARIVTELERRLFEASNIEGIALRYGFFYGPGTWFSPEGDLARQLHGKQFPIIGNGSGVWSWLHIEDAAKATALAAERGQTGIYLVANDRPLAVRDWLPAFARSINAPPPPQVTVEEALQREGGADAVYYGTQMRGVSNAKAKRELGFQPRPLAWAAESATAQAG